MLFQGASGYSIGYANDDVWGYGGKTNKSYLIAKYVDRWHPANITDDPYNPATQWVAGYYPALRHNFSNTSDADPEREERDWGANLAYPLMRTYNFGLNINF